MPAPGARHCAVALLGYVCLALVFAWPLPLNMSGTVPGPPGGDTGVYIWNLWVFRHEIVEHGRFPFSTLEILSFGAPVPLTLHNYTTFANVVAFPLIPLFGIVATFNLLIIGSGVLSAFVMFLFLRRNVGDGAAAWIGGALFGFSPFMIARSMAHFSLVQAAPLPAFAIVLEHLHSRATTRWAVAAGMVIAWAFLCDPYYAVYCLLMASFTGVWMVTAVERRHLPAAPLPLRAVIDIAIVCLSGLIAGIVIRGGGSMELFGVRISMTRLYTPVLVLTILVLVRAWISLRPRIAWTPAVLRPHVWSAGVAAITCAVLLSPVLSAVSASIRERQWIAPKTLWRSSAAGMDLLAFVVPNPTSVAVGWISRDWIRSLPEGFVENVASVPWVVIFTIAVGLLYAGLKLPRYWTVFTGFFLLLALGPFIEVAGWQTHVPTPWAVLRYVPVIGAARMPTRLTVLVMFGIAVLLAVAVRQLRARSSRPWLPATIVGGLLLVELMPAPRAVHQAHAPAFLQKIAEDPRNVKVLHLPFGLRDGMSSVGDYTALGQFYQTFHEKPLIGGYLSRLRRREFPRYRRVRLFRLLFDLSERRPVSAERMERAIEDAHRSVPDLDIGYVIAYTDRASPQLIAFAKSALDLELVAWEGDMHLYKVRSK